MWLLAIAGRSPIAQVVQQKVQYRSWQECPGNRERQWEMAWVQWAERAWLLQAWLVCWRLAHLGLELEAATWKWSRSLDLLLQVRH